MAMSNLSPKIRVPKSAAKGEIFEVKTIITHPMETGLRKDTDTGQAIARDIVNAMRVTYNGTEVFRAKWHPAVSANPYVSFFVVAQASGVLAFSWTDDAGATHTEERSVIVQG